MDGELSPGHFAPDEPHIPHSLGAEQALLGSMIFQNEVVYDVADMIRSADFYEPFHQRLYDVIVSTVRSGKAADINYLDAFFQGDPAYDQFQGIRYLADLFDHAPPASAATHNADLIVDQALRRYLIASADEAKASAYDTSQSALDLVLIAERAMGEVSMNGPQAMAFHNISDIFARTFAKAKAADGLQPGISTGIPDLDKKLGGLRKQNMILIGGRPGMGKSALAVQLAINVASPSDEAPKGRGVAFFSLEMPEEQVGTRFGCALAYERGSDPKSSPTFEDFEKGLLNDIQWQKLEAAGQKLATMPIEIDFRGKLKVSQMLAAARRMKRKWEREGIEPGVIIIDHFGMVAPEKRINDKVQEASQIADDILDMAKVLDMPVVLLCQLARDIDKRDDKRPNLGDLKWSGSLEENAAAVIFCYRPEYYNKVPKDDAPKKDWDKYEAIKLAFTDRLFALLEKNRNGRAHQSIKMFCSIGHNVIQNLGAADVLNRTLDFSESRLAQEDEAAMEALNSPGSSHD